MFSLCNFRDKRLGAGGHSDQRTGSCGLPALTPERARIADFVPNRVDQNTCIEDARGVKPLLRRRKCRPEELGGLSK